MTGRGSQEPARRGRLHDARAGHPARARRRRRRSERRAPHRTAMHPAVVVPRWPVSTSLSRNRHWLVKVATCGAPATIVIPMRALNLVEGRSICVLRKGDPARKFGSTAA